MKRFPSVVLLALSIACSSAFAAKPKANDAVATDSTLPNVLILGDSISIGYTPVVRDALKSKANVIRPSANCGETRMGLAGIDDWLGDGKWDVIHFNWCARPPIFVPSTIGRVSIVRISLLNFSMRICRIVAVTTVYKRPRKIRWPSTPAVCRDILDGYLERKSSLCTTAWIKERTPYSSWAASSSMRSIARRSAPAGGVPVA